MKKNNISLFVIIGIIFLGLAVITMLSTGLLLTQINVIVQLVYTFVTTLMVIFTYKVLKETQEQKNQSVRPYLSARYFDFWHSNEREDAYDLDFEIYNEGMGLALNIGIIVTRLSDKKVIKNAKFTRLEVTDNPIYGELCNIRDEINHIRNKDGNGMSYSPYIPNTLEIEIPLEDGVKENLNLRTEISYDDIYGKRYKSTFDVTLNEEDNDTYDCIEKFEEL